jgi:hypothetical protein
MNTQGRSKLVRLANQRSDALSHSVDLFPHDARDRTTQAARRVTGFTFYRAVSTGGAPSVM